MSDESAGRPAGSISSTGEALDPGWAVQGPGRAETSATSPGRLDRLRRVASALAGAMVPAPVADGILAELAAEGEAEAAAVERLRFLAEASVTLAASLDYHETLGRLVRLSVPSIADLATVHVRDDEGMLRRLALAHRDPAVEGAMLAYSDDQDYETRSAGLVVDAARGKARLVTDTRPVIAEQLALDDRHARILKSLRIRSGIAVPLVARGETLGMLSLMRVGEAEPYTQDDRRLAEELARTAALAIDNARLHTRNLEVNRTLQRSLLPPQLPAVPHVALAAAYHPAGGGLDVGGDFYDVFALGGGRWGVVIGDVCGAGASAAALTAQVRHTARGAALAGLDPAAVAAVVNEALTGTVSDDEFCTLVYAEVSPGAVGTDLQLVRAGHPAPLVVRSDGQVEAMAPRGAVLGALPGMECETTGVHLGPGDALVLVTDGVLETRQPGGTRGTHDFFGPQRLARTLATEAGRPAAVLVSAVERAVSSFSAGGLQDDVAIVVVQAAPGPAR